MVVVDELKGRTADEQLFLLLQSMGYAPPVPLWQYQRYARDIREKSINEQGANEHDTG